MWALSVCLALGKRALFSEDMLDSLMRIFYVVKSLTEGSINGGKGRPSMRRRSTTLIRIAVAGAARATERWVCLFNLLFCPAV